MQTRTPAVAGMFYPDDAEDLARTVQECYNHSLGPGGVSKNVRGILGVICPHAGLVYSGPTACRSFDAIAGNSYDLFVICGPNHWGIGSGVAALRDCQWETPLGMVRVSSEAAQKIVDNEDIIKLDHSAHAKEHSIEVQLPIIQKAFRDFEMLPISMMDQSMETATRVGRAIAKIARDQKTMIVGSSDLTHYEEDSRARKQDMALIEPMLRLDVGGFYDILESRRVSACGYGAIAATMVACKELGAKNGYQLGYSTSGDTTGDRSSVVGYASVVFA